MLRYSRSLASLVALALLAAPAVARRGAPSPADPPEPGLPDKVLAKKAAVELSRSHVEAAIQNLRACVSGSPPVDERKEIEADLVPLEAALKDATWTYDVGNYEEAWRRYGVLERRVKTTQLACDRLHVTVDRCAKSVTAALERVRSWGIKIARIQDPTYRAHCEDLYKTSEKALESLAGTCATTDPAWVSAQIAPVVKPLDEALRKAK